MCNKQLVYLRLLPTQFHNLLINRYLESRMMGNCHVRFGNELFVEMRASQFHINKQFSSEKKFVKQCVYLYFYKKEMGVQVKSAAHCVSRQSFGVEPIGHFLSSVLQLEPLRCLMRGTTHGGGSLKSVKVNAQPSGRDRITSVTRSCGILRPRTEWRLNSPGSKGSTDLEGRMFTEMPNMFTCGILVGTRLKTRTQQQVYTAVSRNELRTVLRGQCFCLALVTTNT
eukprot:TRINITY_DN4906_c0_g1_i1.p1 TRINITY_DN4906_c0_g1~~TRINITY_DN4906_c0_g1_i1.p1  ORF type:complete len:226 (+),score=-18.79 TRINITY_DN4906_c0_g1_i1:262-939(+)